MVYVNPMNTFSSVTMQAWKLNLSLVYCFLACKCLFVVRSKWNNSFASNRILTVKKINHQSLDLCFEQIVAGPFFSSVLIIPDSTHTQSRKNKIPCKVIFSLSLKKPWLDLIIPIQLCSLCVSFNHKFGVLRSNFFRPFRDSTASKTRLVFF